MCFQSLDSRYPGNCKPVGVKQDIMALVPRTADISIFLLHVPQPWVLLKYCGLQMVQELHIAGKKTSLKYICLQSGKHCNLVLQPSDHVKIAWGFLKSNQLIRILIGPKNKSMKNIGLPFGCRFRPLFWKQNWHILQN